MKEELIRIENGRFQHESGSYRFDISIARGECIGVYVDEHLSSGTAYLGVFYGTSVMKSGKAFCRGSRCPSGGDRTMDLPELYWSWASIALPPRS